VGYDARKIEKRQINFALSCPFFIHMPTEFRFIWRKTNKKHLYCENLFGKRQKTTGKLCLLVTGMLNLLRQAHRGRIRCRWSRPIRQQQLLRQLQIK
jgi:hypothetical protein